MISFFFEGSIANVSKVLGCLNGTDSQGWPLESNEPPREFDQGFILFLDPEREATLLIGEWSPREGLRLSLGNDMFPEDINAVKSIGDGVIVGKTEGESGGVEGTCEAETGSGDGDMGAEVELDGVVEFVGVDAVNLRDVEVAVGGEAVEEMVLCCNRCLTRIPEMRSEKLFS
ncbi:hypothetical protein Lal_00006406 [Lupinus albus]|nr:hypothetical protein Lal_00006406 [Lupinus albus]